METKTEKGQSLSILIVEDNRINQMVAVKMLERAGHSVVIADNGQEAVEQYSHSSFDIILMDIQMPVLDGIAATEKIRSLENTQQGKYTPIIALTAHAMAGDRERFLFVGMDDYIAKPIDREKLMTAIDQLVEKAKLRAFLDEA